MTDNRPTLQAAISAPNFRDACPPDKDAYRFAAASMYEVDYEQTIDCAGDSLIADNHGCKAYVAKVRVNQTVNTFDSGSSPPARGRR